MFFRGLGGLHDVDLDEVDLHGVDDVDLDEVGLGRGLLELVVVVLAVQQDVDCFAWGLDLLGVESVADVQGQAEVAADPRRPRHRRLLRPRRPRKFEAVETCDFFVDIRHYRRLRGTYDLYAI